MKKFLTIFFIFLFVALAGTTYAGTYTINGQTYTWGKSRVNKTLSIPGSSLQNGLVGWWKMDGKDTTVTQVLDKSGNNNTLTNSSGNLVKAPGKIGQSLSSISTSATYISPRNLSAPFVVSSSFSLCTWVKRTHTAARVDSGVVDYGVNGNGFGMWITTNNKTSWRINGNYNNYVGPTLVLNQWTHLCNTWDGGVVTIWKNGISFVTSSYTSGIIAPTQTSIGSRTDGGAAFPGLIDDVRVYNRVLSAQEVAALYAMGGDKINKSETVKPSLNSGLVGYWTFDGKDFADATHITDKSGNVNTGILIGSPTKASGKIGQGMHFDGTSSSYVTTTLNGLDATSTNITVSLWANPQGVVSGQSVELMTEPDDGTNRFAIFFPYSSNIFWDFGDISGAGRLFFTFDTSWSNKMAHWVFVSQSGVGQKVYRNGVLIGSDTTASTFVKGEKILHLGYFSSGPIRLKGTLDDVRIYNRALSATEIYQLYQQGKGWVIKK